MPKPVQLPPYQDQELRQDLIEAIERHANACHQHAISELGSLAQFEWCDCMMETQAAVASAIMAIERNACRAGIEAAKDCRFKFSLDDFANHYGETATEEAADVLADWCSSLDRAVDAPENEPRLKWAGKTYTESGKEVAQ